MKLLNIIVGISITCMTTLAVYRPLIDETNGFGLIIHPPTEVNDINVAEPVIDNIRNPGDL